MNNILHTEIMDVHKELSLGVISDTIKTLNEKYTSRAIKDGLSNLKDYIFIVLCDMVAGVEVESTIELIKEMRGKGRNTKEIADILNIKEENLTKLEMGL